MSNEGLKQCLTIFEVWLANMNQLLAFKYGMGYMDFPDWDWSGAFEDGFTPAEAIEAYHEEMMEDDI
jgi:hypothetical protein